MSVDRLIASKIDIANIALFKGNLFIIELPLAASKLRVHRALIASNSPSLVQKKLKKSSAMGTRIPVVANTVCGNLPQARSKALSHLFQSAFGQRPNATGQR